MRLLDRLPRPLPDSSQVWYTLKDTGKTQVFNGQPPFNLLKTLDTGPITNHVNIARNANGMFAYVTVGGLNEVQVFRTDDFSRVAIIPVGRLPHGIWPSGDGTRVYVGLENEDRLAAIDTLKNQVIATSPIGQAAQAIVYVPQAIPGDSSTVMQSTAPASAGTQGLQPAMDGTVRTKQNCGRKKGTHERNAVRPRLGASAGGCRHRPRTRKALHACPCARAIWRRCPGTVDGLHDKPGRLGHRQRNWTDPSGGARRREHPTSLSRDRAWNCCRAWPSRSSPNGVIGS
jgi:hypothetical protein